MSRIQLLIGPPGSGKTERCLAAYAAALRTARERHDPARVLWLTPARESRQDVLSRLLPLTDGVVFQPQVLTFERFAAQVLTDAHHTGRYITSGDRRLILRQLVAESRAKQEFNYFLRLAETEGFLDVLAGFITELKRAEIWPENFQDACRKRFGQDVRRDRELGRLYQRYQELLLDRDWYDAEGRFWLARDVMQRSTDGFWKNLSLVVVDGFSDFTRTQQEMLEQLAVVADLQITLPLEQPLERQELFTKPAGVLSELQAIFRNVPTVKQIEVVPCRAEQAAVPTGLAQVRDHLFRNPLTVPRLATTAGLRLLAACGDESELAAVAWELKDRLARGISPEKLVVALRSAGTSGVAWAEGLTAAGIPVWCEASPPWSRQPFIKMLFALIQLEQHDWPFERLLSVLNSSLFQPQFRGSDWNPDQSPSRVTRTLRRLMLHSRRTAILKTLKRRADRPSPGDSPHDIADIKFSEQVLRGLSEAGDAVRKSHSLADWADVIAVWTRKLGCWSEQDAPDAERLQQLLRAAAQVEQQLAEDSPQRTLTELVPILRVLVSTPSPRTDSPRGRVRIVGAETLRHLRPEEVFLVEVTEDAFPSRRSEDCLYSELERRLLHHDGLLVSHQEQHQREEMLLFYLAVTRAMKSVTLSYSRVDSAGHENYPSPYVTALRELFEPELPAEPVGSLDPLPDEYRLLTATDLRLSTVQHARTDDVAAGRWVKLLGDRATYGTWRNLLAAAETAVQRFHTDGFTPFEGRLRNPHHREVLARRFSPDHEFSATALEAYAACPFRFWMQHVLHLDELQSPDVVTDHLRRGNIVHEVLAALQHDSGELGESLSERFRELVSARLDRQIFEDELHQALLTVERRLLEKWGQAFGSQHTMYAEKFAERQVQRWETQQEVPFGAARNAEGTESETRYPPLVLGAGESAVRLGGRIDRIDVIATETARQFALIDYKSGRRPDVSLARLTRGESLQLALYTLAVVQLGIAGANAQPLWIGYWTLKETGFAPVLGKRGAAWNPLETSVLSTLDQLLTEIVQKLVAGIRAGEFIVHSFDEHCTSFCAFHTVCRVNQIRPLAEKRHKARGPLATLPDQPS